MDLDLYDLDTLLNESLLIESSDNQPGAWVSGTKGFYNGVLTLEVQVLIPDSIQEQLIEEFKDDLDFEDQSAIVNPYSDFNKFYQDSLRGNPTGREIREWCRVNPVHDNPLSIGICPQMSKDEFEKWVEKWRTKGYSNEGSWPGGSDRHRSFQEDCPYCVARFKKGVATGSPHIPAPPLTPDYQKALLKKRSGDFGRACGDPVRPLKFTVADIGIEDATLKVRGQRGSKLWLSWKFADLAGIIMYRYEEEIIDAVKKRLAIPEDSPLYQLIYGTTSGTPSNFKIELVDSQYVQENFGRVPELQALLLNSYSPDAPGYSFREFLKVGEEKYQFRKRSYVDLSQLETHYVYNYLVEIDLGQVVTTDSSPWSVKPIPSDKSDNEEVEDDIDQVFGKTKQQEQDKEEQETEVELDNFVDRLKSIIRRRLEYGQIEEHGYWVDNSRNVFTILKIETGLKGLNFLIDPFMPMKPDELEKLQETDPDQYRKLKLLPSFSPAWYMGGRADKIAFDSIFDMLGEEFDLTPAPYDQFQPYPIGPDGSIYVIREDDLIVLKNGKHVVGKIVKETENDLIVQQLRLESAEEADPEIAYEAPFKRRGRVISEKIVIPKDDVDGTAEVNIDEYDFTNLAAQYITSEKVDQYIKETMDKIDAIIPPEEYLDQLREKYPNGFRDEYGVIEPGEINDYSWDDPKLWSRDLLRRLSTPREVVDEKGTYYRRHPEGGYYLPSPKDGPIVYPWNVIEDYNHQDTPYIRRGNNYINALEDKAFQRILEARGDWYNQVTGQWEARGAVPFYNADGARRVKWIPFSNSAFWAHIAGQKLGEFPGFRRTTNQVRDIVSTQLSSFLNPTRYVHGVEVRTRRRIKPKYEEGDEEESGTKQEVKLRTDPLLGIKYWSSDWFKLNLKRLRQGDLFPSPVGQQNPPIKFWNPDRDNPSGWDINNGKRVNVWRCSKCKGVGCQRCDGSTPFVEEFELPGRVDPNNPLKVWLGQKHGFVHRDLWTGEQYINYLIALHGWVKHRHQQSQKTSGTEKQKEKQRRKRSFWKESLRGAFKAVFDSYDLHCLRNKITREKDKPIDLSGLSETDKLMLVANRGSDELKIFSEEKRDDFITGMIALHTELFYRVIPPEMREFYFKNTLNGGEFRPDVYMSEVSSLRHFNQSAEHIVRITPEERAEYEKKIQEKQAKSLKKVTVKSPQEVKEAKEMSAEEVEKILEKEGLQVLDDSKTVEGSDLPDEPESDRSELDDDGEYGDTDREYDDEYNEYDPDSDDLEYAQRAYERGEDDGDEDEDEDIEYPGYGRGREEDEEDEWSPEPKEEYHEPESFTMPIGPEPEDYEEDLPEMEPEEEEEEDDEDYFMGGF